MAGIRDIELGAGRTILLVVARADDPALFLGGTILRWSLAGWRVVCVRVTDDRRDSVGLSETETIAANAAEFRAAAQALGISEVIDLGYATDDLRDVSEIALREKIVRQIRTHKPYALVSFDPRARHAEDNQDNIKVATAVDEAFHASQLALNHPEHRAAGLSPHGCFERWYFGRRMMEATDVVDVTGVMERKLGAALRHRTILRAYADQLRRQAATGGWEAPMLDAIAAGGDPRPLMEGLLRAGAKAAGQRHALEAAEEFRVVRFSGLEGVLAQFGRRRAGCLTFRR